MTLENKIEALKNEISEFETTEFLKFIAGSLLQISMRNESPFVKGLSL